MREVLLAAPLSFIAGLAVGLAASSRWIIVRRRVQDEEHWVLVRRIKNGEK